MKAFLTLSMLTAALITSHAAISWILPQNPIILALDPLPVLIMVAAFRCPISTIGIMAVFGSLVQNSLSSTPVGTNILPLYFLGLIIHINRLNFAPNRTGTRFTLGAASGAFAPLICLGILLVTGHQPLIGWFSFWQWIAGAIISGLLALLFFPLTEWLDNSVEEQPFSAPYDTATRIIRGPHVHG
tara:strand:+ start:112 stop:669 length:558 start_codon:yes stop_codon:yes gene_type:complete